MRFLSVFLIIISVFLPDYAALSEEAVPPPSGAPNTPAPASGQNPPDTNPPTQLGVVATGLKFSDVALFPVLAEDFLARVRTRLASATGHPKDVDSIRIVSVAPEARGVQILFTLAPIPSSNAPEIIDSTNPNFDAVQSQVADHLKRMPSVIMFGDNPIPLEPLSGMLSKTWTSVLPGGKWPITSSPSPVEAASQLEQAVAKQRGFMQLRLTGIELADLEKDYLSKLKFVSRIQTAVVKVLSIPIESMKVVKLSSGSVIVQFIVFPASDSELKSYSSVWSHAVLSKDPTLVSLLPELDVSFEPTSDYVSPSALPSSSSTVKPALPGSQSDSSSADESDSSATDSKKNAAAAEKSEDKGKLVGVVVGGVLGVGVLGAAVGGYTYFKRKRNRQAPAAADGHPVVDDDRSPGGYSPSGLAQVDIQGEQTPNPYNAAYRS